MAQNRVVHWQLVRNTQNIGKLREKQTNKQEQQ